MPGNDLHGGFAEFVAVPARGLCVIESAGRLRARRAVGDRRCRHHAVPGRRAQRASGRRAGDRGGRGWRRHVRGADRRRARCACGRDRRGRRTPRRRLAEHGAALAINSARTDFKSLKRQIQERAREWGIAEHSWKIFECSGTAGGPGDRLGPARRTAATLVVVGFTLEKISSCGSATPWRSTPRSSATGDAGPSSIPRRSRLVLDGRMKLQPFIEPHPLSDGREVLEQVAHHAIGRRAILEPAPRTLRAQEPRLEHAARRATC